MHIADCTIQCTLYNVHYSFVCILSTLYDIQYTLCNIHSCVYILCGLPIMCFVATELTAHYKRPNHF